MQAVFEWTPDGKTLIWHVDRSGLENVSAGDIHGKMLDNVTRIEYRLPEEIICFNKAGEKLVIEYPVAIRQI